MNHELELETGKKVVLRPMKIKDFHLATEMAGAKAPGNQVATEAHMYSELLKALIVSVDGKTPKAAEKENLDGLFSFAEYNQLMRHLQTQQGSAAAPKMTLLNDSGDT